MGIILKPEDIEPFADIPREKLEAMIADVEAVAVSVAPCIANLAFMGAKQARRGRRDRGGRKRVSVV